MNQTNHPSTVALAIAMLLFGACATPEPHHAQIEVGTRADGPARATLPEFVGAAELLRIALERNPAIAAARQRARAAGEGPAVVGWLPDPKLVIGWYETSVQTRVGAQDWSLGLSQMIPFPTKLAARSAVAEAEARRAFVRYERVARDVLTEVVRAAFEIGYIDEATAISAEISPLLDRYAAWAAGAEVDSALSELFRAESQRAQLLNDRVVLDELRAAEVERLLSLLDLPHGTPVKALEAPQPPALGMNYADMLRAAEEANLELAEAGLSAEVAELQASLAGMRHLPDFTLGVTRIMTSRLDASLGANPAGNGEDPVVLSLGVTLPLWVSKDRAAIRQARALERAAKSDRREADAGLRRRLAAAWYRAGNAERLVKLYGDVLLPRAAAAAETAEDLLAAGKGDLAGALETVAVFHNFRLAEARARADLGRAVAELESIVGRPFAVEGGRR